MDSPQGDRPDKLIRFWQHWLNEGEQRRQAHAKLPPQEQQSDLCSECLMKLANPLGEKGIQEVAKKRREPYILIQGVLMGIELAGI